MNAVFTSYRLGLTGGIGSGKSTVAQLLAALGAAVIDADAISRATTSKNGAAMEAIANCFGTSVVAADGALDREKMRALVYSDANAKKRLEAIVHPLVSQGIDMQAQLAQTLGAPCIVFDIPLLVESHHWRTTLDRILVVDCTSETQIARVAARDGATEADVRKILAVQASRAWRLSAADMVVFNDSISTVELGLFVREIGHQFGL